MDNQKSSKPNKPQLSPYQEGVRKALAKSGEQQTLEAIMQGVPPQHIEQQSGLAQPQDVLAQLLSSPEAQQILALSQAQVPAKLQGETGLMSGRVGLIGGLLNGLQGQGFNPLAQKTEPLGMNTAIQLQGAIQSGQKNTMDAQKFPLEKQKLEGEVAQIPLQQRKLEDELSQAKFNRSAKLRDEVARDNVIKDFEIVSSQFSNINSSISDALNSPDKTSKAAADQASIVSFNKLIDPSSVVRESEYARSTQGQSAMNRIEGFIQKVTRGGSGITDTERKDINRIARKLYLNYALEYNKRLGRYGSIAEKSKVDRESVLTGLERINVFSNEAEASKASSDLPIGSEVWVRMKDGDFKKAVVE